MIKFFVKGHPETDHRPRVTQHGTYMRPEYQAWREAVGYTALTKVDQEITGPVILSLHFLSRTADRQDLDNLAKGVLDALEGVLYLDDRQVIDLFCLKTKMDGYEGVEVMAWTPEQFAADCESSLAKLFELAEKGEG